MRFHSSWIALLPALAAAAEDPLAQYKAQFQTFMDGMSSYIPNPGSYDPVAALAAKTGSMRLNVLTLENWKQTLYENVSPSATVPDDFWIFVTGGNKTCQGKLFTSSNKQTKSFKTSIITYISPSHAVQTLTNSSPHHF